MGFGGGSSLRTKENVPSSAERLPDDHFLAPTSNSGLRDDSSALVTNYGHGSIGKQALTVTQPSALPRKSILWASLEIAMELGPEMHQ